MDPRKIKHGGNKSPPKPTTRKSGRPADRNSSRCHRYATARAEPEFPDATDPARRPPIEAAVSFVRTRYLKKTINGETVSPRNPMGAASRQSPRRSLQPRATEQPGERHAQESPRQAQAQALSQMPMPIPPAVLAGGGASPPSGNARVSAPSPNMGSDAAAAAEVQQAVKTPAERFRARSTPTARRDQTIHIKCITSLSRKLPRSAKPRRTSDPEALKQALERARQNAPICALMNQQQAGGGAPPLPHPHQQEARRWPRSIIWRILRSPARSTTTSSTRTRRSSRSRSNRTSGAVAPCRPTARPTTTCRRSSTSRARARPWPKPSPPSSCRKPTLPLA